MTGLANGGSYTYYVRCQDAAANANPDDFTIAFSVANPPPPDTMPPTVSMTAPAPNATVSGSVTVSATASDNVGVVGVQFLLGGVPLGAEDTTAPYSITWNSTSVANGGPYQLSARARDAATNQTTATAVSVTVNNTNLGLVAAYGFNEGTGTTLLDQTGTGHTGTIAGATWTAQGKFGSALTFDGVNDWVTVNDANDLDFTTGTDRGGLGLSDGVGGRVVAQRGDQGAGGRRGVQPLRQRRHERAERVCRAGGATRPAVRCARRCVARRSTRGRIWP